MMDTDIVVLGAGAAGLAVATTLRRREPSLRVTVVDRAVNQTYRPWLIYTPRSRVPEHRLKLPLAELAERYGFDFYPGEAVAIDTAARKLTTTGTDISYRYLVVAAGAPADRTRIPGSAEHALFPCDVEDAAQFAAEVATAGTVAVVLTGERIGPGLEYAAWLARPDADDSLSRPNVHIVVDRDLLAEQFGTSAARRIAALFQSWDAQLHSDVGVASIQAGQVVLADGATVPAEVIAVVGPLSGPHLPFSSAELSDDHGFVPVDAYLRSPVDAAVYAAGDAAVPQDTMPWRKSWQLSIRQADAVAAAIIADSSGRTARPFNPAIGRRMSRISLPDLGGKPVLVYNGKLLASGRWLRRARARMDHAHFSGYLPGDDRVKGLPK
ncbi:MAG: NAD(P)/FAD-dependent oxidoreductase [Streptomycetales bacterium]